MTVQIWAMAVVGLIFTGSMPLLVWMTSRVLKRLDDLNVKVNIQNGNVKELKAWQAGHETFSGFAQGSNDRRLTTLEQIAIRGNKL